MRLFECNKKPDIEVLGMCLRGLGSAEVSKIDFFTNLFERTDYYACCAANLSTLRSKFTPLVYSNFSLKSFGNICKMYSIITIKPTVNLALIGFFLFRHQKILKKNRYF